MAIHIAMHMAIHMPIHMAMHMAMHTRLCICLYTCLHTCLYTCLYTYSAMAGSAEIRAWRASSVGNARMAMGKSERWMSTVFINTMSAIEMPVTLNNQ